MNITFLIGNGFDLGLGMRSRYEDFHGRYLDDPKYMKNNAHHRRLFRNAQRIIGTWADLELEVGMCSTKFGAESTYLSCVQDFLDDLTAYLCEEEASLDFAGGDTQRSIAASITHALQYFGSTDRIKSDVCQKLIDSETSGNFDCHFLSFNYTTTLQKCLQTIHDHEYHTQHRIYKLHAVQHVHGVILAGVDPYEESPILGVDNAQQIRNKDFSPDDDPCLRRLIKRNRIPARKLEECGRIIDQSDLICIYGMSLGKTDAYWWRKIGNWLKNDPNRQLVIYWFDESLCDKQPHSRQWKEAVSTCRSRFTAASPELDWRREGMDRIHVAVNSKLLQCNVPRRKQN